MKSIWKNGGDKIESPGKVSRNGQLTIILPAFAFFAKIAQQTLERKLPEGTSKIRERIRGSQSKSTPGDIAMQCINCNAQISVNDTACSGCHEAIVFGVDGLGKGYKKHPPGLWLPCSNVPKQGERQGSTNSGSPHGGAGGSRIDNLREAPAQKSELIHYTLNTGHSSTVARTHVPDYAIDLAKSMLRTGRHPITFIPGGYECEITFCHPGLLATVFQGQRALVIFGVAPNDNTPPQLWQELESSYLFAYKTVGFMVQKPARCPERTPWCAVVMGQMRQEENWLASFEQMVAWAWIETINSLDSAAAQLTAAPNTALAWEHAQKGDAQRELGNYDQAIADCTQAIRLDSTIGYPWGIRGLCYQLKGNLDQAISDCTEAIRLEPQNAFNYETRAECYRLLGKMDLAMADCSAVIRLDPMSAHAYRTRAGLHLKAQNLDATIADCDEAIRLDPNSWTAYKAYARRGIAYRYKGDFEKAVADCSEAIRLYPQDSLAFHGRADAFLAKGDTGRAIQDCTEAIRLNPKDGVAYKTRAGAHVAKGEFDSAIADCTEALRINPKIASAFATRGEAHRMKGDLDMAFADFTEAIRLDPNDLEAFRMRGHIQAQRGDIPSAIADLVAANRLVPSGESNLAALMQLFHPPHPFSIPQALDKA